MQRIAFRSRGGGVCVFVCVFVRVCARLHSSLVDHTTAVLDKSTRFIIL